MIFIACTLFLLVVIAVSIVGSPVSVESENFTSASDGFACNDPQDAYPMHETHDPFDHNDSLLLVNPATGLPMMDDIIDVGGNVFGISNFDHELHYGSTDLGD